eukprot:gene19632-26317_t
MQQSITPDQLADEYFRNAIIPPPSKENVVEKQVRLLISSRNWNVATFPLASKYPVTFDRTQFVKKVELLSAYIPFPDYTVDASNDTLYFSEASPTFDSAMHKTLVPLADIIKVSVPRGTYDGQSLAPVLHALINDVAKSTVSVQYDVQTNRLGITSDLKNKTDGSPSPFTLTFMNNGQRGVARASSIHAVLGYAIDDYYGAVPESVSLGTSDTTFALHDTSMLNVGDAIVFSTSNGDTANVIVAINNATGIVTI